MKLNNKRFDYWIYNLVYGAKKYNLEGSERNDSERNSNLPNNLCSYFWKTFFGGLMLLVFGLVMLPVYSFKSIQEEHGYNQQQLPFVMRIFVGACLYFIAAMIFSAVAMWFTSDEGVNTLGTIFYGILILLFLIFIGDRILKAIKNNAEARRIAVYESGKVDKPNLLIEFLKAKKEKYCPRIEWTQLKKE